MAITKKKTKSSKVSSNNKNINKNQIKKIPNYSTYIIINLIVSILLVVFMYIDSSGLINSAIKNTLLGLFGKTSYLVPVISIVTTIYISKKHDVGRFKLKVGLSLISIIIISALVHILGKVVIPISSAYQYGVDGIGGGLLGSLLGVGLYMLFKKVASVIILFFILFILVNVITKVSIFSAIWTFLKGVFVKINKEVDDVKHIDNYEKGVKAKENIYNYKENIKNKKNKQTFDFPIEIDNNKEVDNEINEIQQIDNTYDEDITQDINEIIDEDNSNILDITAFDDIPIYRQDLDNIQMHNQDVQSIKDIICDENDEYTENEYIDDFPEDETYIPIENDEIIDNISDNNPKFITIEEKENLNKEIEQSIQNPFVDYVFPSINLLKKPKVVTGDLRKEMYETANKLIEILKNFNVEAKLLQVTQGPSVTRYEIQPNTGVKLSKIVGLADDLALNLAVATVLVAPVPGKAAVGIEVPNREVGSVSARELLESDDFINAKSKLSVALGKDIGGRVIIGDIAKMPHVLIAGATGSGKSVCINTIITSILYKAKPEEVKLIMVDPKVVELGVYNGIPHLLIPVVTDPKRAAGALNWAVQEMMKRYDLFAQTGVRNLEGYNKFIEKSCGEKMPQIVIIIDELADLMMVAAKEVEDYVCRLAQLARAAGIHLIIATQRPSVDVITGLIKANVPSRIAFSVSSQVDSRTILDKGGAEKLLGKGDMLYFPTGARVATRVQGAFVSDGEIESIVTFLKDVGEKTSYSEDLAEHIERCSTGENGVTPDEKDDGDDLLPTAIDLAVELGQISTAMIQRRLKVGYSRAGRIIDQMEARGIISGANGSKPREVYRHKIDFNS